MAATQVSAVMNSYMSPHGARCTASPLVVTAITCAPMPSALSVAAARTHGPASAIARSAPTGRAGRAAGTPGAAEPATPEAPAAADADPADAAPTAASAADRSATGAAAIIALRRGRPNA